MRIDQNPTQLTPRIYISVSVHLRPVVIDPLTDPSIHTIPSLLTCCRAHVKNGDIRSDPGLEIDHGVVIFKRKFKPCRAKLILRHFEDVLTPVYPIDKSEVMFILGLRIG